MESPRLGEGLAQSGEFTREAKDRVLECLGRFKLRLYDLGVGPPPVCVATSQARRARDAPEFFTIVRQRYGFEFTILDALREAQLSYEGTIADESPKWVLDVGGGSTELSYPPYFMSFELGAVRLTQQYDLTPEAVACRSSVQNQRHLAEVRQQIGEMMSVHPEFEPARRRVPIRELKAVAGTATALGAWQQQLTRFEAAKIEGIRLTFPALEAQIQRLLSVTLEEQAQVNHELAFLGSSRRSILLGGALILVEVLRHLGLDQLTVSTRGLRYALINPRTRDSGGSSL